MATGTAWYNLTKPASTENYNLSIWNTNLDMIDEQMHQNETESFTGATDLANGTVGNVPAPQIADKEKFLKGDGTWDTPSGGGDASAMKLTQAEYDALTQEEKENGTIYFVGTTTPVEQLIPRVSGADSAITSSGKTQYSGGDNWHAFDGVENTSGVDNCWAADENNTSAYIQYHFSQPYYLTQIQLKLYSHYSGNWTGTLNILGSNDGSNWTNISSTGHAISVTAPLNEINIKTIDLNSNNAWDYIRVQANGTAFNIAYQPTCDFSEIYVYGTSTIVVEDHDIYYMGDKYTNNTGSGGSSTLAGLTDVDLSSLTNGQVLKYNSTTQKWENADESGGSSAEEMTLDEYNALTTDQKNDGTIRFIPESSVGATNPIDMLNPTNISEGSNIVITPSEKSVEITWNTSASTEIGATFYYSQIDITDYDYLVYDLVTGDSYDSLHPGSENPIRDLGIGLCSSAPSTWAYAPNINWTIWNRYEVTDTNKNLGTQTLDVSELSGEYYLVIAGVAWEATISNLKYATSGGNESQIKYMSKTYGIGSGGSGSESDIVIVSRTDSTSVYAWLTPCDANGNPLKPSEVTLLSIFAESDMSGRPPYYNGLNVCVDTDRDRYNCKLYDTQTGNYASDGVYSVDYTVAYIPNSGGSSGGGGNSWTDLTAVLEAGETSLTIIDSHITINGTYDFYTSKYGLNPLSVVIDDPFRTRLLQPLVTQESELIVTATASTNWSGFEPWKAFADSAVNSGWIASEGSGGYWLQAEFPYEVNISSIDFKSLDSNRSHAISRVSYSNDGNTFTDATLTSSTMQNNIGHADVSMSKTAKYIRLCFDYSLDMQTYPMVSQLELYGGIDSSSAGSMTLTFEEQTENINVKVRVS